MTVFEYAVGDIHGRSDLLNKAIETILAHANANDARPRFIFLGDYVDRGPDSMGVIDSLIDLQQGHDAICLKGNHEDMMVNAYTSDDDRDVLHWHLNGGATTQRSYSDLDVTEAHLDWASGLPLFHETDHRFFVHAGVSPHKPINAQSKHDYLWIRNPFLQHFAPFDKYHSLFIHFT